MRDSNDLHEAQQLTANSLARLLQNSTEELTRMNLEEVTELADDVARVLPAGNVVTMVFSQLSSIRGKQVSDQQTRQMLGLLKQGMSTFLDKATYLTFYTTPSILIQGYQQLLELAGQDPNAAFPDGTWQFYLEFGLREDSARHACETQGLQWALTSENLVVDEADQLAAWILATTWLVERYDYLIWEEWRERILLRKLGEFLGTPRISSKWVERRPYAVPDGIDLDYIAYRQGAFHAFVMEVLSTRVREKQANQTLHGWYQDETLLHDERLRYRNQMSICSRLEPGDFSDERQPIPLENSQIAVFHNGEYHFVPVVHNGERLDAMTVRTFAQSILNTSKQRLRMAADEILIQIPRQAQNQVRQQIGKDLEADLEQLRHAPIIINWDAADPDQPLAAIRQGRRGLGDHPLTLFRTHKSMVFDQSHIYFDAIWGMAISEIITNQAIDYLRDMPTLPKIPTPSLHPPACNLVPPKDLSRNLRKMADKSNEVYAEISFNIMQDFAEVRRLLTQRHADLRLTVNDLLVLYRSMYNQHYQPSRELVDALEIATEEGNRRQKKAAREALNALAEVNEKWPAFLIPIDATALSPKERIYPVTFRPQPPWTSIAPQHWKTWEILMRFEQSLERKEKRKTWQSFNEERTSYLEMLRMFNVLMLRYKEVALAGESLSTRTLKILATVPKRLQSWLSTIPDKIDLLNDMLKGTEVFSNAGRVADTSSLTRFITAKDDNEKKVLCWGVMTRADDMMVITLRDFRPWVMDLKAVGLEEEAQMVTQDYLDGYAEGLYQYLRQLSYIVRAAQK